MKKYPRLLCLLMMLVPTLLAQNRRAQRQSSQRPTPPSVEPANNSYCLVCHMAFADEALVKQHAAAGIGCSTCHGKSTAHASDESNLTAPEIMYSKNKIDAFCLKCHRGAKHSFSYRTPGGNSTSKTRICTDCHGKHHLPVRTRNWDKATGQLLPQSHSR